MDTKIIKYLFWNLFAITVLTLVLSLGLFLAVFLIIVIPVLVLHIKIGLRIDELKNHKWLIIISMLNLLLFSLIRPDGVHSFTQIGIESLFNFFGIYVRLNQEFENYYFNLSLALLTIQIALNIILLKKLNKSDKVKTSFQN